MKKYILNLIIIKLFKAISKCTRIVVLKRFVLLATVLFLVLEMKGESYQRALMMLYPIYLIVNYKNNLSFAQNENKSKNIHNRTSLQRRKIC